MRRGARAVVFLVVSACDPPSAGSADAGEDARVGSRGDKTEVSDGLGPGCRLRGALAGIEADESCVVASADGRETLASLRTLVTTLAPDSPETLGGGQLNLRLAITNTGKKAVALVLEGEPPGAGSHYDWALLTGLSPPRVVQSEGYKLRFMVKTLDARDISVDQLRVIAPATPPPVRLYRIVLAPQASLSHTFPWMALGIPAPYPPFEDDAGHRIVPKTAPRPLAAGKYTVVVDVPFYGVAPPQRTVSATVGVMAGG